MSLSRTSTHSTVVKRTNKQDKTKVFLKHTCYICGDIFSKASPTISHVRTIHGYSIPSRLVGHKRPQNKHYEYVTNNNEDDTTEMYACPSCWFHCPDTELQALNKHIHDEHDPIKVDDTKDDDYGYVSASATSSNNHGYKTGRRGRTNMPATSGAPDNNNGPTVQELAQKFDELNAVFKTLFC